MRGQFVVVRSHRTRRVAGLLGIVALLVSGLVAVAPPLAGASGKASPTPVSTQCSSASAPEGTAGLVIQPARGRSSTVVDHGTCGEGTVGDVSYGFGPTPTPEAADSPNCQSSSSQSIVGLSLYWYGEYWQVASDGSVMAYGGAPCDGSMYGSALSAPIAGITATTLDGYWMFGTDGAVYAFGDAGYYGGVNGVSGHQQTVALVGTPDNGGYWEIDADGGVFSYGDAQFYGSLPSYVSTLQVVAATNYGNGYALLEANGRIDTFNSGGHTEPVGPVDSIYTNPAVGMATDGSGGFWVSTRTGTVMAYGSSIYEGQLGSTPWGPIDGVAAIWYCTTCANYNSQYDLTGADGGLFAFNTTYSGHVSVNSELSPAAAQNFGHFMLAQGNWGSPYYWASGTYVDGHNMGLQDLWQTESYWDWNICPTSTGIAYYPNCSYSYAYGIPQADPAYQMCDPGYSGDASEPLCPSSTAYETNAWTQLAFKPGAWCSGCFFDYWVAGSGWPGGVFGPSGAGCLGFWWVGGGADGCTKSRESSADAGWGELVGVAGPFPGHAHVLDGSAG